jgi:hypothetical protein
MLLVGNVQQQTFGWYIDGDRGGAGKNKGERGGTKDNNQLVTVTMDGVTATQQQQQRQWMV